MVDVLLLAGLYTLRVLAGIAAAQVRFSTWLLAFSMFLFLSLAFLKRYTEVSAMDGAATASSCAAAATSAATANGSAPWAARAATSSVLVLALYINSEAGDGALPQARCCSGWSARSCSSGPAGCGCWPIAGRIHDDPIVATVRDPVSYVIGALVLLVLYPAL